MRKKFLLYTLSVFMLACVAACGNSHSNKGSVGKDTTGDRTLPPPADNSSATNPSLADTAYPSKTDTTKK